MGTTRGLYSSLRAGISLVVAGVLALVVASSVVAFRGWPGVRTSGDTHVHRLADHTAERPAPGTRVVVGSASGGAGLLGVAVRQHADRAQARSRGSARVVPSAAIRQPSSTTGSPSVASAAAPDGAASGPGTDLRPQSQTGPVGQALGGVEQLVDGQVPLPDTVRGAGQVVDGTLEGVGQAAQGLVGR